MSFAALLQRTTAVAAVAVLVLSGCGGGGSPAAPPAAPSVTQTINAGAGGTINGPGGTTLTVPPNALAADTAITIAIDAAGAPTLPAVLTPLASPMIALLPHDTTFGVPVTLSLPAPAGPAPVIAKTNETRDGWQVLDSASANGQVSVALTSFSHVAVVSCVGPPFTNPACSGQPAPQIIGEPRDSPQLFEGGFWIFRVDVVAAAPYTFRWMRNGAFMPAETNQDILLNPLLLSDDGDLFSVVVTDSFGRSITSRAALLRVAAVAPTITNSPADVQVSAGGNAVFAAASTSSVAQTVQWKQCAANAACAPSPAQWLDLPGETAPVLVLTNAQLAQSGTRVAMCASNAAGSACSGTAQLTVLPLPVQPQIVAAPQPVSTAAGTSASFTVVATGGALSFEWQGSRDGIAFVPELRCTDSATCTLSSVVLGDDGLLLRVRVSNSAGQATSDPPALLTVRLATGVAIARLAGQVQTSIGLRGDGRLTEWGGQAGSIGATAPFVRGTPADIASLAAGNTHALAIRGNGEVFAWGSNSDGQLGDGSSTASTALPQPVPGLAAARSVAAGMGSPDVSGQDQSRYSVAVTAANGLVFAWGANLSGQLGNGGIVEQRQPVPVGRISGVSGVAAGGGHVLARRSDGSLWAWGRNNAGQLGNGTRTASLQPIPVPLADIAAVAAGHEFSIALRNDGTVLTWGGGGSGKLGDGTGAARDVAAPISLPAPAIAIAAGAEHGLALLLDGRVYAWGRNGNGQVGSGSVATVVTTPQRVVAPLPASIVAIGAGTFHSLALDADGNVWAWGLNSTRQLFDGTTQDRLTPVQVQGANLN